MVFILNYLIILNLISPLLCLNRSVFRSVLTDKPKFYLKLDSDLGTIIGYKQNVNIPNVVNKTINVFYGVPYSDGKPKRFRKANLIEKFPSHTYYATEFKPHCPRAFTGKIHKEDKYSEDCLRLNIWTPNIEKINGKCIKKFNVMVTFVSQDSIFMMSPFPNHNGNGELYFNPELLTALHDTIAVIVNNRHDLFNSLYLDGEFNGNLMLFDQYIALKWVKQNIKDYCGNNKITLVGNSLSSQAVQAHLMSSKYSKYLIDHAILQSYSLFAPSEAMANREELMINSMIVINELGCINNQLNISKNFELLDGKIREKYFNHNYELKIDEYLNELNSNWNRIKFVYDKHKIDDDLIKLTKFLSRNAVSVKCLEDVEIDKIMKINRKYSNMNFFMNYDDNDFFDKDAYLDYKLNNYLIDYNQLNVNPNITILFGALIDEICELTASLKDNFYTDKFNIIISKKDAKKIIKNHFNYTFEDKSKAINYIANYYTDLNKHELREGFYDSISNYRNDLGFKCPLYFHSEFMAKTAKKIFTYIIDYKFINHVITAARNYSMNEFGWMSSCHADETMFLYSFGFRMPDFFTDLDRKFNLKLIDLWASFARDAKMPNLKPGNKKWPSSNKNDNKPKFVQITGSFTRKHKFDFEKRCNKIWRSILLN